MPAIFANRTVVVSSGPSWPNEFEFPSAVTLIDDKTVRKWRLFSVICIMPPIHLAAERRMLAAHSPLQFPLQLVEKAPVGPSSDNLFRARLDHSRFVQAKSVEPHAVFRVILAPLRVTNFSKCLEGVVVLVASAHRHPSGALGVGSTDVGCLQDQIGRAHV